MKDKIIVLNSGSSSLKCSVLKVQLNSELNPLFAADFSLNSDGWKFSFDNLILPADSSLTELTRIMLDTAVNQSGSIDGFIGVGHRVVHGGKTYDKPCLLTDKVIQDLDNLIQLAPLHQPSNLAVIKAVSQVYPSLPQVASFDSAFHSTQLNLNKIIAIPSKYRESGIQNYGFHGLSYEYVSSYMKQNGFKFSKFIVAHLGSGSSLCALYNFQSRATTMGFSALNGLLMGTRPGSIDPAVILYMLDNLKLSSSEIQNILYKQSGLLAVSGKTANMKELLDSENEDCNLAVELFVHRAVREIGSLAADLQGVEALVFTGGIGENSAQIRASICDKLGWLGLKIDSDSNMKRVLQGSHQQIHTEESKVKAYVIPTNENLVIARQALAVIDQRS